MSDALTASPEARFPFDRRGGDRRRRATPMLSRYTLFGGRRAHDRRNPGSVNQYVDRYPPMLATGLITIGLLCALDAVFTLIHLQKGGSEANPIMDALITVAGPRLFLILKCVVTNVGLLVLCVHKNFRFVRSVIGGLLLVYAALLAYHIYLMINFN